MGSLKLGLCLVVFVSIRGFAQVLVLPAGTPLPVQTEAHLPMRVGQAIQGELIYPVYADNVLVLPAKTVVTGTVVELRPNHARRVSARLRGDFTPFRTPIVSFNGIKLADGRTVSIATGTATDGAPLYRLVAPPPRKGGFLRQRWDDGVQVVRDKVAIVTGPDKGDRLTQFLYTQLPYHPQRIEKKTAWTVETSEPVSLSAVLADVPPDTQVAVPAADGEQPWIVQAYLNEALSSANSKTGQTIEATVAEPIYNPDHTIAVPQGATMLGVVTQAKAGRSFGRAGTLHFDFRQLVLPSGTQNVQASLTGADSVAGQNLAMNSEGQVKPKPQDKLLVPLLLLTLAARPLDHDHGDNQFGKTAVASNSIGLVGFIVGTAAGQRNLAAGLGYYGAAISLYERWIKRGREVSFARDTRLVLQTTPRRSTVLRPELGDARER